MALGKALKKVAKCSKELSQGFGDKVECGARNEVVCESFLFAQARKRLKGGTDERALVAVSALLAANGMFEALAETDAKHAKVIQRQYEEVNEVVGRAFKKIAVRLRPDGRQSPTDLFSRTERGKDLRRFSRRSRLQGG